MSDEILRVLRGKAETRAFYNKISKVYDFLSEHSEAPIRAAALERLEGVPTDRILEIGFGTGHNLVKLARAVAPDGRVYGVDLSDRMAAVARDLIAAEKVGDRVHLACADAAALPFAPESLNGILVTFTLELFDTPEIPAVLAECKRVLKPGGRLAVAAISKEHCGSFAVGAYEWTHRHFPNLLDCRPIYARRSMEDAGFWIGRADTLEMWGPVEVVLGIKR